VVPSMLPEKTKPAPPRGSAKAVARYMRKYLLAGEFCIPPLHETGAGKQPAAD
jgi:hypothetical protein